MFVIFVHLIFFISLLVGVLICKKISFYSGVYFFIIIIFTQTYEIFEPFIVENYFIELLSKLGIRYKGEWVATIILVPKLIYTIAFSILIYGIYTNLNKRGN